MKAKLLTCFVVAAALLTGCGPTRPLTESEFKGNCYNSSGIYQYNCDVISLCNEYLTVMNTPGQSFQQCWNECQRIYTAQTSRHLLNECYGAAGNAKGWCQRYCKGRERASLP